VPADRIGRLGEDENFWPANAPSQGPDGVCGPCSEIYYHTDAGEVEIWNLVFTQFNRVGEPPNNLRPLPSKNIDTGMGLERAAAVLQGVESNFHIDILRPLVEAAADVCEVRYDPQSETGRRLRRIADHVRACSFAVHENVYPGPNKEKYVVKRLLRRAVLDGHQIGIREPFLHKLVPVVAELMRTPYPELSETTTRVAQVIAKEEENFQSTIDAGLERIERFFEEMKTSGRVMVAGGEAADMYATYGFPPELFESMAAERNFTFDWDGFRREMEQHGIESGGGHKVELFAQSSPIDALKKAMHGSEFVGHQKLELDGAKVIGIIASDQLCEKLEEVNHEHPVSIVLDKTPFYGEMGGQVGDHGELSGPGFRFEVTDTQAQGGFTLHVGHLREGRVQLGTAVTARVSAERRNAIRRAHSATHILHYALQKHLGGHAQQQGSKVDDDWLRFDFSNPSAVSRELLDRIEDEVNLRIMDAAGISAANMPLIEARKTGAMMLFGEKYPDVVRVVSVGGFSKELCGGTHLDNTGRVGLFKILSDESVSAGTRRITALTGRKALAHVRIAERSLAEISAALKIPAADVPERVAALAKEVRQLKKQQSAAPKGGQSVDEMLAEAADVGDVKVVVAEVPTAGPQVLRQMIDQMRKKAGSLAVLLASPQGEGKVMLLAGLSRDLVARKLDAVAWVRKAAELVDGGGGGRPDMAQAGGKDDAKLAESLDVARSEIRRMLGAG